MLLYEGDFENKDIDLLILFKTQLLQLRGRRILKAFQLKTAKSAITLQVQEAIRRKQENCGFDRAPHSTFCTHNNSIAMKK